MVVLTINTTGGSLFDPTSNADRITLRFSSMTEAEGFIARVPRGAYLHTKKIKEVQVDNRTWFEVSTSVSGEISGEARKRRIFQYLGSTYTSYSTTFKLMEHGH